MTTLAAILLSITATLMGSSGFWMYVIRRGEKDDAKGQMLMGLGHDRILYLASVYIKRGWITQDEYENLSKYLHVPYTKLNGNGCCDRVMKEVDKLPIRAVDYSVIMEEFNEKEIYKRMD